MLEHPLDIMPLLTLLFSAALYPVGIMLGSSCSPCCRSTCDEVLDFHKCVRAVRKTKLAHPAINRRTASVSSPSQIGASYSIATGKWQMQLIFPGWSYPSSLQSSEVISDSDTVESFLRGDTVLDMTLDGDLWEVSVGDATTYCGAPFCIISLLNSYSTDWLLNDGLFPRAVTYTAPSPRQQISKSGQTYENLCYTQEQRVSFPIRLNAFSACRYSRAHGVCEGFESALGRIDSYGYPIGPTTGFSPSVSIRDFYCAQDILSAIEDGPCRTVVPGTLDSYFEMTPEEPTYVPFEDCFVGVVYEGGTCMPSDVTISYANDASVYASLTSLPPIGTVAAGDYVLNATGNATVGNGVPLITSCNSQLFRGPMPVTPTENPWTPPPSFLDVVVYRSRQKWCDPFPSQPTRVFSTGFSTSYGPGCFFGLIPGLCGGNYGEYLFGESPSPVPRSISAQPALLPATGGDVLVEYCCPQSSSTVNVTANADRVPRTFFVRVGSETALVTQQPTSSCRFGVAWRNSGGQLSFPLIGSNASATVWMPSSVCPLIGVITTNHLDGSGPCEWTATTPADWLSLSKSPDGGLLYVEVSADSSTPYTPDRSAEVTISTTGNTQIWTVVQKAP